MEDSELQEIFRLLPSMRGTLNEASSDFVLHWSLNSVHMIMFELTHLIIAIIAKSEATAVVACQMDLEVSSG